MWPFTSFVIAAFSQSMTSCHSPQHSRALYRSSLVWKPSFSQRKPTVSPSQVRNSDKGQSASLCQCDVDCWLSFSARGNRLPRWSYCGSRGKKGVLDEQLLLNPLPSLLDRFTDQRHRLYCMVFPATVDIPQSSGKNTEAEYISGGKWPDVFRRVRKIVKSNYSDTSANEDNSFRNHIR